MFRLPQKVKIFQTHAKYEVHSVSLHVYLVATLTLVASIEFDFSLSKKNSWRFFPLPFLLVTTNCFVPHVNIFLPNSFFSSGSVLHFIWFFSATFTCVVNNLGGYRVSGDGAQARVGTLCVRVL